MSSSDDNGSNNVIVTAHTLRSVGHDAGQDGTGRGTPLVAVPAGFNMNRGQANDMAYTPGAAPPVCTNGTQGVQSGMSVRRLTPIECARLQGFSDDWLELDPPLSDSAKYRLLGNAVAWPVATWLGKRLKEYRS